MTGYRKILYERYHSTQENRDGADNTGLFKQQIFYYSKELLPFVTVNKQARILDIGCGNGAMLAALQQSGFSNMQGIDVSPEQVSEAKAMGINQVEVADASTFLKEHKDTFDAILAIDVIEHFTKDELLDFLQIAASSLKQNGMLLFRTPNMDAPLTSVYSYGDFTHECLLNKSSALQVMASAGFQKAEVFPSLIFAKGLVKEIVRKWLWSCLKFQMKMMLYATGRTWNNVVFTPNLIIRVYKS